MGSHPHASTQGYETDVSGDYPSLQPAGGDGDAGGTDREERRQDDDRTEERENE